VNKKEKKTWMEGETLTRDNPPNLLQEKGGERELSRPPVLQQGGGKKEGLDPIRRREKGG